ncbi:MAG: hypothetical protein IPK07_13170 [Deltaproteobacteria bacterium]|nr:hypothetical protein [Deltaproteobacteria bacterium]
MANFRSDNNAGLVPEALDAMVRAGDGGHAIGYGDDLDTARAVAAFQALFGAESAAFFVATGTAANTLAVASLTRSYQRVLCHEHAHWCRDESTAPERITGCRTHPIPSPRPKLTPDDVRRAADTGRGDVHEPQPGALTISNPTELGVVYTPEETAALAATAHDLGYRVHVDGARFASAVAFLGVHPRALTTDAGIDALSFGGTKNGLAFGEAVIFFPQGDGHAFRSAVHDFPYHRKASGHLLSKHRFVSAPFDAVLADGAWLRHARHANAMARRLGDGLTSLGHPPALPIESNGVFLALPANVIEHLRSRGHEFYGFGDPAWNMVRLMAAFDTRPEDVDALIADVRASSTASD